jgi:hypothetical protein
MRLAFSNSFFLAAVSFLPARLMNICTIRIADPIPPGETSLRAIIFATASTGFVNVPCGGKVDTVLTFADHFRLFVAAISQLPRGVIRIRLHPSFGLFDFLDNDLQNLSVFL